jgi:hypothetical protein
VSDAGSRSIAGTTAQVARLAIAPQSAVSRTNRHLWF